MFRKQIITQSLFFMLLSAISVNQANGQGNTIGQTSVMKWQYGKRGAVSITYDDGSVNQFKYALPVMERLKLPATFFVITGGMPGSKHHGKFIGRPVKIIIAESETIPTSQQNFFERCSAGGYLGYKGTISYVTQAAGIYDDGNKEQAFKLIDDLYQKVRKGEFKPGYLPTDEVLQEKGSTWDDFRSDAAKGYEFGSHSITHASMPALDSANIAYELEKSKEDIQKQMGVKYTFSAEVPYGYEDPRVMTIAHRIYPALRNRMPETWLKEIDRASAENPGNTDKDYIQWQRGATTKTPLKMMESWVDTAVAKNNTWLVLVIHGVDGLGYEALPHTLLDKYFQYIKSKNSALWIATFGDVTKYMRERENVKVTGQFDEKAGTVSVAINNPLGHAVYNIPLTFKTYVKPGLKKVQIRQGQSIRKWNTLKDEGGTYVQYQAKPNEAVLISPVL